MIFKLNVSIFLLIVLFQINLSVVENAKISTKIFTMETSWDIDPSLDSSNSINPLSLKNIDKQKYYLGISNKINWFQAFLACRQLNMDLAIISSEEDQENITKLLIESGVAKESFWTSGADLAEQGKYFWMSNGKQFTFSNWRSTQPDNFVYNGVTEHCIEIYSLDGGKTFIWNDTLCSHQKYFICEV